MDICCIKADGVEMEYFSFGRGKKVFVILPGVAVKSVMLSAKAIRAAYRCFEDDYTVYVFDRRKDMPDGYTVRAMADDTAAAMKALGIRSAYIFGASQGGMMAMCLAVYHPSLVRAMVLGSTASKISDPSETGTSAWIELAEKKDMQRLTADFITNLYSDNTIGKYKELLIHMNDDAAEEDIRRFIIQTRAIDGFSIDEELPRITCPVLVIGSEGDRVLAPDASRRIAEKIGCELYMYGSEYGHCVFDEAPDYKERIMDFFNRA